MDVSNCLTDSSSTVDIRARRRKLHTEAEQRRRDAIKKGFDSLLELLPPTKTAGANSHFRISKATILNRSISMILRASKIQDQKRMDIDNLQKKVQALKILKASYERMSNESSYITENQETIITEQFKLQLFQMFMERLFQSFDSAVSASSLPELADQIISWLEISCKPEVLHQTMENLLESTLNDDYNDQQNQPSEPLVAHQNLQPQNPTYSDQTSPDCLCQQLSGSNYRQHSVKLSTSLEGAHESSFMASDQPPVLAPMPDRYQQNVVYNSAAPGGFNTPNPDPYQASNYSRNCLFPTRHYPPNDETEFAQSFGSSGSGLHEQHTPPSTAFSGAHPGLGANARSLVVNSSLPGPLFGPMMSFPPSAGVFGPGNYPPNSNNRIPVPNNASYSPVAPNGGNNAAAVEDNKQSHF